jgi:hypothetical protein
MRASWRQERASDGSGLDLRRRMRAAGGLFVWLGLGLAIPFLGLGFSIMVPFFAGHYGPEIWPGISRTKARFISILAFAAIWGLIIPAAFGVVRLPGGSDLYAYHLIPLCSPRGLLAAVASATSGLLAYSLGCALCVVWRRPFLWPAASLAGVLALGTTWTLLHRGGSAWIC